MTDEAGWVALGVKPVLERGFDGSLQRDLDRRLSGVGTSAGKRFGGFFGKAAIATSAGIIGAGFAAFRFTQDALGEAREAQEVGRTTAAILKSTRQAANLNRREYDKLTTALMNKTAIDDEQIATGGNLLLTFKNVKREGKGLRDIFGRALAASLDLTAAGFGSIESTSKQLGKALNDPVKGMSALNKSGVTFTQDQQDTIKSLVETGDLLGAQKIILKEVESQVGGTAEKQKTSAKELEVAWGNLKEEIGGALIPVLDDLAEEILPKIGPAGREISDWLTKDGIPAFKDFAKKVRPVAEDVLPVLGDTLSTVKDVLADAAPYAVDLVQAFNDMPSWAKKAIVAGGLTVWAGSKVPGANLLPKSVSGLAGLATKAKPLPVFVVNNGIGGVGADGVPIGGGKGKGGLGGKVKPLIPSLLSFGTAVGLGAGTAGGAFDKPWLGPTGVELTAKERENLKRTGTTTGQTPDEWLSSLKTSSGSAFGIIDSLEGELNALSLKKIQPEFDVLGLIEAEGKILAFRERLSKPIHIQVITDQEGLDHSTAGGHEAPIPGETPVAGRRFGGVVIQGDLNVEAHDYRDVQRNIQQRSQAVSLGAIGVLDR